ncbi:MAG: UDP-N-acetylmuramoyl-tripeptide--D-alanyl-D-alanine ligase [Candidatus Calescibacterium sp.]|nr:UDP-N-acetylmuramoyl-tripeptide--D-alanyl-D-alanine ligase [Candidatus Calescibacterium sp.]MDW8133228.1 UDP-N-acetylmuramoyl-tripeptide--D-alanyl-D-alanine ligase [Candidatus Calescibacterium sp.]
MINLKLSEIISNTKVLDVVNLTEKCISNIFTDTRKIGDIGQLKGYNQEFGVSEGLFICIRGENFDGHDFICEAYNKGVNNFVIQDTAKIPENLKELVSFIVVKDTVKFMGDLAKLVIKKRKEINENFRVIAVAGSAGKTTTKNIIKNVFEIMGLSVIASEKSFNNEIGVPLTVFRITNETQVLVLEMGMRGFGQIEYLCSITQPDYGVITSIGPEHLEFVKNIKGVIRAETELTDYLMSLGRYFIVPKKIKNIYRNYKNFDYLPNNKFFIKNFHIDLSNIKTVFQMVFNGVKYDLVIDNIVSTPIIYNLLFSLRLYEKFNLETLNKKENIHKIIENSNHIITKSLENDRFYFQKISDNTYVIADYYNSNYLSLLENLKVVEKMFNYFDNIFLFIGDMLELGNRTEFYHSLILRRLSSYPNKVRVYHIGNIFYSFKDEYPNFVFYESVDKAVSDQLFSLGPQKKLIFIKGSRALKLEKIHEKILNNI